MSNLLKQAINFDDGDRAVKIIQDAPGILSDDVRQLPLPKDMASRPRAARPHYRQLAADGGAVSRRMTHSTSSSISC